MAKKRHPIPSAYTKAKGRYPGVLSAYEAFGQAVQEAGPLSLREQRLVKLGLAFGARMEGASHSAVRKALESGVSAKEIEHAALLAMTTMGFANGMTFLSWARDIIGPKR